MGEQNTGDARNSVPPRRGPRPFVGPASAPGQPLPLLRANPTRPAPRPFVPSPGARPSLGTTTARPASPVVPNDALTTPEPMLPEALATPVAPAQPVAATPVWLAVQATPSDAPDTVVPTTEDDPAPDRFAAFDAVWPDEPTAEATPAPAAEASLLDVSSLGSGHTDELWAADIVSEVPTAQPTEAAVPAWLLDDPDPVPIVHVTAAASDVTVGDVAIGEPDVVASEGEAAADASMLDASWADVAVMPSADAVMAAGLDAANTPAANEDASATWPDPLLAEYAPYVPTPTPVAPVTPVQAVAAPAPEPALEAVVPAVMASTDETVASMEAASVETAPPVEVAPTHASLVAASLDRLAERVRDGQIDVSSVAPEGPDAAVLAAVLAALLGGGRSSSR